MRDFVNRVPLILASVLTALAVASCGSGTAPNDTGQGGHNLADVVFVTYMIPHHQQGVDLAAIVPAHTGNPNLVKLASGIVSTQEAEIGKMANMVTQWSTQPDTPTGAPTGTAVTGKVEPSTFGKLGVLTGNGFDTLWLQSMIEHHRGALEMAKTEISSGHDAGAVAMAKQMVSAQQGQIDQMTKMLGG